MNVDVESLLDEVITEKLKERAQWWQAIIPGAFMGFFIGGLVVGGGVFSYLKDTAPYLGAITMAFTSALVTSWMSYSAGVSNAYRLACDSWAKEVEQLKSEK
jgi:hypothetical protein